MNVVTYPHPALRYQSKQIKRVDRKLKSLVEEMFELMYEHKGIGLAANQVALPFQLFVINPSGERGQGEERVLINPVIQGPKGNEEAEEGCLSLPNVYGKVTRPAQVHVVAYDMTGEVFDETVTGILARVIQHENDHLNGVLFTDRMVPEAKKSIESELDAFEIEYQAQLKSHQDLEPDVFRKRAAELEGEYC